MSISMNNILSKKIVIGLSYFDHNKLLLNQKQLMGTVSKVDKQQGISILLTDKSLFVIPCDLTAWFTAPKGRYFDKVHRIDMEDPDYLITWDIYQKQRAVKDNIHQWWDWKPRTTRPEVKGGENSQ